MSPRASSGSKKKSPLIETLASRPSRTSRSATTSLPPRTLYSPCRCSDICAPCIPRLPSQRFSLTTAGGHARKRGRSAAQGLHCPGPGDDLVEERREGLGGLVRG